MSDLDVQIRKARVKRRAGYTFFGLLTIYLSAPMLIGAFGGVASGEIWDPYTGVHLSTRASDAERCFDEASALFQEAGRLDGINFKWDERAKVWMGGKCPPDHPELLRMMERTRSELRKRKKDSKK